MKNIKNNVLNFIAPILILGCSSVANATIYMYEISSDGYDFNGVGSSQSLIFGTALIDDTAIIDYYPDGITPEHIAYNFTYRTDLGGITFEGAGAFNFLAFQTPWPTGGVLGNYNEWDDFGSHDSAFSYTDWQTTDPFNFQLPVEMWNWDIDYNYGGYTLNPGGIRLKRIGEATVPAPTALALLGLGLVVLGFSRQPVKK